MSFTAHNRSSMSRYSLERALSGEINLDRLQQNLSSCSQTEVFPASKTLSHAYIRGVSVLHGPLSHVQQRVLSSAPASNPTMRSDTDERAERISTLVSERSARSVRAQIKSTPGRLRSHRHIAQAAPFQEPGCRCRQDQRNNRPAQAPLGGKCFSHLPLQRILNSSLSNAADVICTY